MGEDAMPTLIFDTWETLVENYSIAHVTEPYEPTYITQNLQEGYVEAQ
jgi:hypothetical protein